MYYSGMHDVPFLGALSLQECGKKKLTDSWQWNPSDPDKWSGLFFWVVTSGQGTISGSEKKERSVIHGDILIIRLDRAARVRIDSPNSLEVSWCLFDWQAEADCARWAQGAESFILKHAKDLELILRSFRRASEEFGRQRIRAAEIYLQAVLAEFAASHRYGNTVSDDWMHEVNSACNAIYEFPDKAWDVETLAKARSCSADHYARMFRRHAGQALGRFVIQCRVDRAKKLLLSTKDTIATISQQLGYSDPFFFSKQFKLFAGLSPSQYRLSPSGFRPRKKHPFNW